eukprot:747950-Hanusia_phi.AAC.1
MRKVGVVSNLNDKAGGVVRSPSNYTENFNFKSKIRRASEMIRPGRQTLRCAAGPSESDGPGPSSGPG